MPFYVGNAILECSVLKHGGEGGDFFFSFFEKVFCLLNSVEVMHMIPDLGV